LLSALGPFRAAAYTPGKPSPARTREKSTILKAALAEGLICEVAVAGESGAQILPADYHIEAVEEAYDSQPDWKPQREIS
jgi:hypothetical protein